MLKKLQSFFFIKRAIIKDCYRLNFRYIYIYFHTINVTLQYVYVDFMYLILFCVSFAYCQGRHQLCFFYLHISTVITM